MRKMNDGVTTLHVRVAKSQHTMLKKLAIDTGLSVTDIISQYLDYLQRLKPTIRQQEILHEEGSKDMFQLDY